VPEQEFQTAVLVVSSNHLPIVIVITESHQTTRHPHRRDLQMDENGKPATMGNIVNLQIQLFVSVAHGEVNEPPSRLQSQKPATRKRVAGY
jgi:hypothetical protein